MTLSYIYIIGRMPLDVCLLSLQIRIFNFKKQKGIFKKTCDA
jgi:hypothetical protein